MFSKKQTKTFFHLILFLLPLTVFIILVSISTILFEREKRGVFKLLHSTTDILSRQASIRLEDFFTDRISSLELLAENLSQLPDDQFTQQKFLKFAETYYNKYPGFQAINWIDDKGVIRWVHPLESNQGALNRDLHLHPSTTLRATFNQAEINKKLTISTVIPLLQGGIGFTTYIPIFSNGVFRGFLNGVFKLEPSIRLCLHRNILDECYVRIFEGKEEIFSTVLDSGIANLISNHTVRYPVNFKGKQWIIAISPNLGKIAIAKASRMQIAYIFGFFLSLTLSLLIFFLIKEIIKFRKKRDEAADSLEQLKKVTHELQINEDRYRTLVEYNLDGFYLVDAQKFLFVNQAFAEIFGYNHPREIINHVNLIDLISPNDQDLVRNNIRLLMEGKIDKIRYRFTGVTKEKRKIRLEAFGAVVPYQGMRSILGTVRDVTEQERSEELYRRSQKLESLGLLAGGIAHDFNNYLLGILGNSSVLLEELSQFPQLKPYVQEIISAAERSAVLIHQMLAYAGKVQVENSPINLNHVILEITKLLRASLSKKVYINFKLEEVLPMIEGDEGQIQQVIMNIVTNACESIGDNTGSITIITGIEEITRDDSYRFFPNLTIIPGKFVFMQVDDTGCGMNRETMSKIFDPFFGTKSIGRGLGLSTVLGIVKSHGGVMKIDSQEKIGTSFKVYFPSSLKKITVPKQESIVSKDKTTHQGTILVIDDEEMICKLASKALSRVGYKVLTALNGLLGMELFRKHKDEITCVLLDMTMPELSGEEFFYRLQELSPDIPVIFSSGYTESEYMKILQSHHHVSFLQKPYKYHELIEMVESMQS